MPADPPHIYDVPKTPAQLVSVSRASKFQIDYVMSDEIGSSFRCTPEFADFVMEAWAARNSSPQTTIEQILEEVQELAGIVRGIRDAG